ncbi:MAG: D-aminoacyl-tRNA deacylase [Candidatus Eisenbacteria bacterium]
MKAVVQRVSGARVSVAEEVVARIGKGFVILLGVKKGDTEDAARWLARKCAGLRVFEDDREMMNLSLGDVGGAALVVSQFTLYGDCDKGRRPSFTEAAPPGTAETLYEVFVRTLREDGIPVKTGRFQAKMLVEIANDGPVTLILER